MPTHTKVERLPWKNRFKTAFWKVIFGPIFILLGTFMLIYGEAYRARITFLLQDLQPKTTSIASDTINLHNNGKIVHLTDSLKTNDILTDSLFCVSGNFLKLFREVKMYQWYEIQETKTKELPRGEKEKITTYKYKKAWHTKIINDEKFEYREYENPDTMLYPSQEIVANDIQLGAFLLDGEVIEHLKDYDLLNPEILGIDTAIVSLGEDMIPCLTGKTGDADLAFFDFMKSDYSSFAVKDFKKGIFIYEGCNSPLLPEVGDYQFIYWGIPNKMEYTFVGEQQKDTLQTHKVRNGFTTSTHTCGANFKYRINEFMMLMPGKHTISTMYEGVEWMSIFFWVFMYRLGGFVCLIYGFKFIAFPIALLPVPIRGVGPEMGKWIFKFSFVLACMAGFVISGVTFLLINKISNLHIVDYYFCICLVLMFLGIIKVRLNIGGYDINSKKFLEL